MSKSVIAYTLEHCVRCMKCLHVTPEKASRILKEHIGEGKVVDEYTVDTAEREGGKL